MSLPYDQRLARVLVRPLVRTRLHPNHLTVFTALLALCGAALLAAGDPLLASWGAGVFVLSRFLDHFDGELARQTGRSSRLGYLLDYLAGGLSYAALFAGMAAGLSRDGLGTTAWWLGALGVGCAIVAVWINLRIDEARDDGEAVGYPALGGFELEDGIYLLAPVTWLGWLAPFFVAACLGACVYLLYSMVLLLRSRCSSDIGQSTQVQSAQSDTEGY
jgi:phosphatidylglycerophosphate synthase